MDYFKCRLIRKFIYKHINKIFIILLIFFLFMFFYGCFHVVFGVFNFTYNNNTFSCSDLPVSTATYQVLAMQWDSQNNRYICRFYTSEHRLAVFDDYNNNGHHYGCYPEGGGQVIVYYRMTGANSSWSSGEVTGGGGLYVNNGTRYQEPVYWSNHELRCYNNQTDIINNFNTSSYNILINEPIPPENYENYPYFLNSTEDIAMGEQDLIIMPGDFANNKDITFVIQEKSETTDSQGGVIESWHNLFNLTLNNNSIYYKPIDETGVGFYYVIPWDFLIQYLSVSNEYDYILSYTINGEPVTTHLYVTYGGLTPEDAIKNSLSIQNDLTREQINQQTETNEKLDELNDNITDDTIESTAEDLPSTNVNNPTENGIDNIFQSFYNAFCTGTAQDIVFPIPFTNKNITLNPYYVKDMLNNNGASWVYTFIQAFWGYLIGRYIIKDISRKIDKIKGGDIENIENENIKEDML